MSVPRLALVAGALAAVVLLAPPAGAQAASEARPAAEAASGTADIHALEQQVESVLTEARRQQAQLNTQRQRLAAAESANAWLPLLFMAMAALVLVCGVLGLRLWRTQRRLLQLQGAAPRPGVPAADPAASVAVVPGTPGAAAPASARLPERPLLGGLGVAPVRRPADLPPARALGASVLGSDLATGSRDFGFGTGVPPRTVSVEELLDLDQQVEFFLALGQAQSAIDLLLGHVRSTGGTNAQPYFKLLEIYREQADEDAYERTRERFNQRFNALAPDWTGDLAGGRLLEDYPDVVARLQRAWPQSARAVAEIDGLLLRRADLEPFDLPAYRDLLLLHALARDLHATEPALAEPGLPSTLGQRTAPAVLAREAPPAATDLPGVPATASAAWAGTDMVGGGAEAPAAGATVDLLLPLGEHTMEITLPQPHLADRPLAQAMLADWVFSRSGRAGGGAAGLGAAESGERPAAPLRLDLDLSEHAPAPREFTRPAAFTDIDMRRDRRLSDLGGLDENDPLPSRR